MASSETTPRHTLPSSLATFADRLFTAGAIQFGEFRLKLHETHPNAPPSPIFLNLRMPDNPKPGPLTADLVGVAGRLLYEMAVERDLPYTRVCGVPRAGDPFANVIGTLARKPVLRLVKKETDGVRQVARVDFTNFGTYGGGEPEMRPDEVILLVDDLITGADSKLEAIAVIGNQTVFRVTDVVVLVDRQQGGVEALARRGVRVHALMTLDGLLAYYLSTGRIDQNTHDRVKSELRSTPSS